LYSVLFWAPLYGALWYGGDIRWPLAWSTQHAAAAIAARQDTSLPDISDTPKQPRSLRHLRPCRRPYCYYYAHLDRYAPGLKEGTLLRQRQVLGYLGLGSTGDAQPSSPHLHFAIFRLGAGKSWWRGTAIDPRTAAAVTPAVLPPARVSVYK
jgi:hypothetical protein